ncbi:MAG: dipicolinate synthase subunit B [Lachnospiraceae bacterium]|nr:dipicolinate synthase subunit B [Lachnospiraceae bacterium]
MDFKDMKIGFALTGSFCTFTRILEVMRGLNDAGADIHPIFSKNVSEMDSRFWKSREFIAKVQEITGRQGIFTIQEAEPIGPKGYLDVMVIAPCTGNTMAKLAAGITDTPVLMAAKAHLRNEKPLIIAVSTNDALGMNLKNIGLLMNTKNIYFVPFGQDDYIKKPLSLVAHMEEIPITIETALKRKQIQPVVKEYSK